MENIVENSLWVNQNVGNRIGVYFGEMAREGDPTDLRDPLGLKGRVEGTGKITMKVNRKAARPRTTLFQTSKDLDRTGGAENLLQRDCTST